MPPPRLGSPLSAISSLSVASRSLRPSVDTLHYFHNLNGRPSIPTLVFTRNATHQAQGRANGPKNGPGKRLGAKKTGEEYVIPGNIIFKQRGTQWHAGENCSIGRDHSIYATQPGFVKYYRDPQRHPKRRYIGVVFERNMTLPTPPNAARRRRLGMYSIQRTDADPFSDSPMYDSGPAFPLRKNAGEIESDMDVEVPGKKKAMINDKSRAIREVDGLKMRPDYSWRQGNWEIGRIPELEGHAQKVRKFDRKDRFLAWRKREARKARAAEKRSLAAGGKRGKGKSKKSKGRK